MTADADPTLDSCPECGAPRPGRFCESCGYDFVERRPVDFVAPPRAPEARPLTYRVGEEGKRGLSICSEGHESASDDYCDFCGLPIPDIDRFPAEELAPLLSTVEALRSLEETASATPRNVEPQRGPPVPVVTASAKRMAMLSVQVLPALDQARYAEEFAGELHDLAGQGAGRWRQLVYALRLASRVWPLRVELRAEAPWKVPS